VRVCRPARGPRAGPGLLSLSGGVTGRHAVGCRVCGYELECRHQAAAGPPRSARQPVAPGGGGGPPGPGSVRVGPGS
jgi:hypothetical protein